MPLTVTPNATRAHMPQVVRAHADVRLVPGMGLSGFLCEGHG